MFFVCRWTADALLIASAWRAERGIRSLCGSVKGKHDSLARPRHASRLFPLAQLIGIGDHQVEQSSQTEQHVLHGAPCLTEVKYGALPWRVCCLALVMCRLVLAGAFGGRFPPSRDPYSSQAPPAPHTLNAEEAKGLHATLGPLAAFGKSSLHEKLTVGLEPRMRVKWTLGVPKQKTRCPPLGGHEKP
jgi:hypothetical protein